MATAGGASQRFGEATRQLDHLRANKLLAEGKGRGLGGGGPDPARDTPTSSLAAILIFFSHFRTENSPEKFKVKEASVATLLLLLPGQH